MQHNFKPLKRRQSKAFALRRQELTQRIDSSIDTEKTQNISDYWNAATSKLQIEETILETKSKGVTKQATKKLKTEEDKDKNKLVNINMKKSFDEEYLKDLMDAEVEGVSESAMVMEGERRYSDVSVHNSSKTCVDNVIDFFEEDDSNVHMLKDSNIMSFNKGDIKILDNNNDNNNDDYGVYNNDSGNDNNDNSVNVSNHSNIMYLDKENRKIDIDDNDYNGDNMSNLHDSVINSRNKENMKIINTNKKDNLRFDFKVECEELKKLKQIKEFESANSTENSNLSQNLSFIKTIGNSDYISNINEINGKKDRIAYLLQNQEIETSVIFLKGNSIVKKMLADKSFSLLLLKGHIMFVVNGNEITLKRFGLVLINKNDEYSIQNGGKSDSILFLTYAI